ncbi:uncharacterized protein LOC133902313 [Phragmites australis]|uniref:uncharacterized protein LOC133902313 n=1 Tax=Phragmites australis TaxID=29695 RepID=UPI002D78F94E|nr:uncharacterized protein LOC133902313 [Phragmites australis]
MSQPGLSLKSTSATRLYIDLDLPETWQLIDRYSNDETLPKIMEVNKSIQGTLEEQMFYNRRTLQEITEMRHDNPTDQEDNTKDSPVKKTSNFVVHCEEDIEDRDESNIHFSECKRNNSLSRSRCIILDDDSDEYHTKRTTPKEKDTKVCSKKKKIIVAKSRKGTPKVESLEFDENLAKQKAILEQAIKTGIRLGKKIDQKKRKCKDTGDQISRIKDPHRKRKGRNVIIETEIPTYQVEQTINSEYIEDDNNDKVTTNEYEIDVKKRKHKDTGAHTIRKKGAHKKKEAERL